MHARPTREQWVFGLYDTVKKFGCVEMVPDRSSATLIPLIKKWVLPGTIIQSDGWSAYGGISNHGFQHEVVIHENNFVDPITGVHTNAVEAYWQRCKKKFKRINGAISEMIPSYLDEFMWIERYGKTFIERWNNLILHMKDN